MEAVNTLAKEILTTAEAATYTRMGKASLERLRVTGGGPRFARLGANKLGSSVRYRRSDLDEWIASRLVSSTSEAA